MIVVRDKIKVFISSACGEGKEKYNIARAGLKSIIESTGIADVYLFEDEGASTSTAKEHYTEALERCDICVFLIDNYDGVPTGVQVEVDYVKKHNIKSLYYFCDKGSKEITPLQGSLMGANFAKSKVIHSFEEVVKNGASDFINDLMHIYKKYCKGSLGEIAEIEEKIADASLSNSCVDAPLVVTKNTIANITKCKKYFLKLVYDADEEIINSNHIDEEIINSNHIDEWCYKFLHILFENKSITDFNLTLYIKELGLQQSPDYHEVVKIRWQAIQAYFQGDLEGVVIQLQEALNIAKENEMPEWIIKDILIDLRNQRMILNSNNNRRVLNDLAQKEIEAGEHDLYYPLLDRFANTLNEMYIKKSIEEEIKSPYTVSFMNNLSTYTDLLANIYVIAMFNGSLTHIVMMYDRLKLLSFHLCQTYSNWNLRILLVKCALMSYEDRELEGILHNEQGILGSMTASHAYKIFNFTNNQPIKYQRMVANLAAIKSIGYFLDDEMFKEILDGIRIKIEQWLDDEDRCIALGNPIISALSAISFRVDPNLLATVCLRYLELGMNKWIDEVCMTIGNHIDLSKIQPGIRERLLNQIELFIKNDKKRRSSAKLQFLLLKPCKKNKELTENLIKVIQIEMPIFYEGIYRLEMIESKDDSCEFIRKYIDVIESRNISQGQNGGYLGYMDRPHLIIKSIMDKSKIEYDIDLLQDIFEVSSNTLLAARQTIGAKCDAIELLTFLCNYYPDVISKMEITIEQLKKNREIVEDGKDLMSNLSVSVLKFIDLFLYYYFGEEIGFDIVELLPLFGDDIRSQVQITESLCEFLAYENKDWLSRDIESVLLQQALVWCKSSCLEIRRNAIQMLFRLLGAQNNKVILNQLIKTMDNDTVYIKNTILRLLLKDEKLDTCTRNYLLQKAEVDTHFVVRKVYKEVKEELDAKNINKRFF